MTKLSQNIQSPKGTRLTSKKDITFKIAIEEKLDNGYDFKKMKQEHIKSFHNFLEETIYKELTITKVEKLFLRTKGKFKNSRRFNGKEVEEIHLGKDRDPFRIFGYYKSDYFVITRIDPKHKTHK
ncbi:MAG6450 family protein [Helcococcus sueciensis]|uniref:MAG6450 family protein n=1 Tax=Helcococcus sueciensis TaxID=241555 RepID=UPI0003F95D1B|nr:hypothetical protein [Helcococcus sueciensis]